MGKPAFITNFSNKPAKPQQQRPSGSRTQTNNTEKSSFQETFTNIGETFSTTFSSVNNFRKKLIWNRIRLIVCVLIILMFILQIVVTAVPSWLHLSDSYEQGLWKVCTQVEDGTECFSYKKFPGKQGLFFFWRFYVIREQKHSVLTYIDVPKGRE